MKSGMSRKNEKKTINSSVEFGVDKPVNKYANRKKASTF
jgi:hypothetical protein